MQQQQHEATVGQLDRAADFRIDVSMHDLLMGGDAGEGEQDIDWGDAGLPEPVYPRVTREEDMTLREYQLFNAKRTALGWGVPFVKSRWYRNDVRPIIPYLFTEWKCNYDCHYCWSFNNDVKGMQEPVARESIDWLHSIGSRVLALMGGEPLLRPRFIHKITDYAAQKGFFVYLPTNGRLMKPDVIDRLGDAGVGSVNLAIDCVDEKPGLPKALSTIRPQFEHLIKRQRRYGYLVMLNINITRINMDDVKELTEIARDNGVGTDYHINEAPMLEQDHFQHYDDNSTYLREEDFDKVDEILDWVIDKHDSGYKIVNPIDHIQKMKKLMRGGVQKWNCRAGKNSLIIRTDGTLAPCFPMYSAKYDWGKVGAHKFEEKQLTEMKKSCMPHCLSTCNYILGHAYNTGRVIKWGLRQAMNGFRGATGSF